MSTHHRSSYYLPFAALLGLVVLPACGPFGSCLPIIGGDSDDPQDPPPPAAEGVPIVLAHGLLGTERYLNVVDYWVGIQETLQAAGHPVYVTEVDPLNSSTVRGAQLGHEIEAILEETGEDEVIIIGHSQGGLDARVVAHDHPEMVRAVVTIGTPHDRSPFGYVFVEAAGDLLDGLFTSAVLDFVFTIIGPVVFDQRTDDNDFIEALRIFTRPGIDGFNARYPDSPSVDYMSIAGRSSGAGPRAEGCRVDGGAPPFISRWDGERDPLVELAAAELFVSPFGIFPHDGVVAVSSAKHGRFLGCIPADHLDQVGQLFGDGPGIHWRYGRNHFDYLEFYAELVDWIRAQGY